MGAVRCAIGAPRGAGMHWQVATRIEILAEAWAGGGSVTLQQANTCEQIRNYVKYSSFKAGFIVRVSVVRRCFGTFRKTFQASALKMHTASAIVLLVFLPQCVIRALLHAAADAAYSADAMGRRRAGDGGGGTLARNLGKKQCALPFLQAETRAGNKGEFHVSGVRHSASVLS